MNICSNDNMLLFSTIKYRVRKYLLYNKRLVDGNFNGYFLSYLNTSILLLLLRLWRHIHMPSATLVRDSMWICFD